MKRLFATLLALCMLLSLAACGGQNADDTGKTTTTQNPMEQMAGKYILYHAKSATEEMDYFHIRMNDSLAGMYFDLRADGTLIGNVMGNELSNGATWTPDGLTNAEGDLIPITIANGELKFELNNATFTMLKEGDPRLDEPLPNMFKYLHDYIVTNGTQDDRGHTVVVEQVESEYGYKVTMTATADGKIFWNHENYDGGTMEMELVENAQFQTVTMLYKGYSADYACTATVETATASYDDFQLSTFAIEPDYSNADTVNSIMNSRTSIMFKCINRYLKYDVGISMTALGFANFKY